MDCDCANGSAVNDLAERGVETVKKVYHKVNNYQRLNKIVVTVVIL